MLSGAGALDVAKNIPSSAWSGRGRNTGDLSCKRSRHRLRGARKPVGPSAFRGRHMSPNLSATPPGLFRGYRRGMDRFIPAAIQCKDQVAAGRRKTSTLLRVLLVQYQPNASASDITRGAILILKPMNTCSMVCRLDSFSAAVHPSKISVPTF